MTRIRGWNSKISILLRILAVLALVLSATAAGADFHPGGEQDDCVLCQINHLPLAKTVATTFSPESTLYVWWKPVAEQNLHRPGYKISLPGRSPPTC